jgi:hypothetical protein
MAAREYTLKYTRISTMNIPVSKPIPIVSAALAKLRSAMQFVRNRYVSDKNIDSAILFK